MHQEQLIAIICRKKNFKKCFQIFFKKTFVSLNPKRFSNDWNIKAHLHNFADNHVIYLSALSTLSFHLASVYPVMSNEINLLQKPNLHLLKKRVFQRSLPPWCFFDLLHGMLSCIQIRSLKDKSTSEDQKIFSYPF